MARRSGLTPLRSLLENAEAQRAALRRRITPLAVHRFAKTVDDIAYRDVRELGKARVDFEALVERVHHYYRRVLGQNPDDGVATNNIGVFMANHGNPAGARPYFVRAVRLRPRDRNAHENLRVADILTRRPRARWHDYPERLKPGKHTLAVYFDPHGM